MINKRKNKSKNFSANPDTTNPSVEESHDQKPISDSEAQTLLKSEVERSERMPNREPFLKDSIIAERYRLEELIGEGGMGQVWRAYDNKLDRSVALKRLGIKIRTSEESYLRFIREAKVLSKLNHPNICGIYDLIEDGSDNYISMEYIPGVSLAEAIKKSLLSKSQKIDTALGIAEGLAAAHGKGIVHRDLKPSNIMIEGAKILDFGLAKQKTEITAKYANEKIMPEIMPVVDEKGTKIVTIAASEGSSDKTPSSPDSLNASDNLTSAGSFLGTVKYMSPEQARGEEIDFRSDIFSFGIILYEMFSGKNPFTGHGLELLYNIQVQNPKPLYKLHTGCPVKLARLIDKAMEKDKDKRPNGQMFIRVLNSYKNRLLKKPSHIAAVSSIGIALAALAILQFTSGGKAKEVYTLAMLNSANRTGDPSLNWIATGLSDTVRTTLQESARINPVSVEKIYSLQKQTGIDPNRDLRQDQIIKASDFLGKAYVCTSSLRKKGANYELSIVLFDRKGMKSGERVISTDKPDLFYLSEMASNAIIDMLDAGKLNITFENIYSTNQEANKEYFQGLELLAKNQPIAAKKHFLNSLSFDPTFSLANIKLAEVWRATGYHARSVENLSKALIYQERLPFVERYIVRADLSSLIGAPEKALEFQKTLLETRPDDPEVKTSIASSYIQLRKNEEAREVIDELLQANPDDPYHLYQLGILHSQEGNHEQGITAFKKAFNRYIAIGNKEQALVTANELSWLYIMVGKYKEASDLIKKTIILSKEINSVRDEAKALSRMGSIWEMSGDIDKAEAENRKALALYQKIDDLKGQADTLIDIAFFRQARGDFTLSEQLLLQSLELWNRMADKQGELKVSYYLGWIYYNRGDFKNAKDMFNNGLELAIDLGNQQNLTGTNGGLGSSYIALGDIKKAEEHFRKQLFFGQTTKDEQAQSTAYINLALTEIFNGNYEKARKQIQESEKIVRKSGDTWTLGTALAVSGWTEVSGGKNYKKANKDLAEAIPILEKNQNNSWLSLAKVCYSASRAYTGDMKADIALREIDSAIEFCKSKGRIIHLVEEYKIKCDLADNFKMASEAFQACSIGGNLAAKHGMTYYKDYFAGKRKTLK